jgi:hypothetical protein
MGPEMPISTQLKATERNESATMIVCLSLGSEIPPESAVFRRSSQSQSLFAIPELQQPSDLFKEPQAAPTGDDLRSLQSAEPLQHTFSGR